MSLVVVPILLTPTLNLPRLRIIGKQRSVPDVTLRMVHLYLSGSFPLWPLFGQEHHWPAW